MSYIKTHNNIITILFLFLENPYIEYLKSTHCRFVQRVMMMKVLLDNTFRKAHQYSHLLNISTYYMDNGNIFES